MTLVQRLRAALIASRARDKSLVPLPKIRNRSEARSLLRGNGPFWHVKAKVNPERTTLPGRTRRKRDMQRNRVRDDRS